MLEREALLFIKGFASTTIMPAAPSAYAGFKPADIVSAFKPTPKGALYHLFNGMYSQ
jgi:hypothetical protein